MNQCSKHSGVQDNPKWKVIAYQIKIFTEGIQNNDSTGVNIDAKKAKNKGKEGKKRGEMEWSRTGQRDWHIKHSSYQGHRLRQLSNPV